MVSVHLKTKPKHFDPCTLSPLSLLQICGRPDDDGLGASSVQFGLVEPSNTVQGKPSGFGVRLSSLWWYEKVLDETDVAPQSADVWSRFTSAATDSLRKERADGQEKGAKAAWSRTKVRIYSTKNEANGVRQLRQHSGNRPGLCNVTSCLLGTRRRLPRVKPEEW